MIKRKGIILNRHLKSRRDKVLFDLCDSIVKTTDKQADNILKDKKSTKAEKRQATTTAFEYMLAFGGVQEYLSYSIKELEDELKVWKMYYKEEVKNA